MNWKNIIAEIQEYGGLTQAEIGKACETTQSTIGSLIATPGAQPRYALGEKIKALHKKHSRKPRTVQAA